MEDLIPLYNKEFYLAYLCGEDVVLPIPDGNAERYLAYLCGMDVTIPDVPDGRTETYLAYKCGEDVVLPDPMYRIEYYLAKWCGIDCEVPEPLYRIEYWLAQLANSGELKTVTGNPISVSDALAKPAESLVIEILPQQDLHGYANPWPAGGGDNKYSDVWSDYTRPSDYRIMPISLESGYWRFYATKVGSTVSGYTVGIAKDGTKYSDFVDPLFAINTTGAVLDITLNVDETWTNPVLIIYCPDETAFNSIFANYNVSLTKGASKPTYSPYSNICPITGFTGVNIYHESAYDGDAEPAYTITWQTEAGTVYGGELDVTTGVLTVTKVYELLNDSTKWQVSSSTSANFEYAVTYSDAKNTGNSYSGLTCSYVPVVFGSEPYGRWLGATNHKFGIKWTDGVLADIQAAATAGKIAICYELATPISIQLTPTEIEMLLGNNVIWNDVGDMVLEYLADGPADDIDALQILLGNRYVNNGGEDEATDKEALEILLGGNTR